MFTTGSDFLGEQGFPAFHEIQDALEFDIVVIPFKGHESVGAGTAEGFRAGAFDEIADDFSGEGSVVFGHGGAFSMGHVRGIENNEVEEAVSEGKLGGIGDDGGDHFGADINEDGFRMEAVEPDIAMTGGHVENAH